MNVRFTSKTESKHFISLLDIKVSNSNINLTTSVYHKASYRGIFTNFENFPADTKMSQRKHLIFALKDALDWPEMKVTTIFF